MDSVKSESESMITVNDSKGDVINGYIVYTRRKRTLPSHNGNETKRIKTEEENVNADDGNVEIEVKSEGGVFGESGGSIEVEVVQDDVVICRRGVETTRVAHRNKNVIVVNKKPLTVKELFDTGLVDGVPVIYMGNKKDQTSGLRGVIQDGGILCSCSICNRRRVIPPSQFEIHACNTYKRATEYICLENGKSLLELLRACRTAPLHTLEATIQNFVCSLPEEKYFTCKDCKACFPSSSGGRVGHLCCSCLESRKYFTCKSCKACFPSSSGGRVGHLCHSCLESRKSEDSSINAVGKRVRTPKAASELYISSKTKRQGKKRTMSAKLSVKLKTAPITSNSKCSSPRNKSQWRITKKYQRLHKLLFEDNGLPDGAELAYYARGQKLLEGIKRRSGIFCGCCNTEISPSQFEVHAGWDSRKKPYAYIYTSNGVSLHELAIFLSKDRQCTGKYKNDLCIVCWNGGKLLQCDGCSTSFHKECASLSNIPRGEWYCQICQNMFHGERSLALNADAVAAGRVAGVDPIEQIAKRCIRIVKDNNIEADISGCALCRGSDFSRSGFGPRTVIFCDQCEKEYHVGCLRDHKMAYLKELPEGNWFCCNDCSRIHSNLENLLVQGDEKLPESLLHVIKKKQEERCLEPLNEIDVRWRLLNGKIASSETRPLLLEAVSMFRECFDPIVDAATGRDLVPPMVYGRNVQTQDFGGMYCALLMVNSSVVSAGMLRIFGGDIAELPLVATSFKNRGKGYFQTLFSCIERLLALLNVKTLVLPASEEVASIWTDKFGFSMMKPDQLIDYRRNCNQMMAFKGTIMLHKVVPPCRDINTQS
ncbi:unnamed protein product [Lupinus luteus]|uniref:PHD-type domain-containing protein n=1 Tax=Lupinus luteus TaxID=3873 RepID=A0AAV1X5N3_LUPLU